MFETIVVALDGSQCAVQAFDVALGLAKAEGSRMAIISVVDPILIAGTTPPSPASDLVLADMEKRAQQFVDDAAARARKAGVVAAGEVHLGVPYEEILRCARSHKASAIVIGTHGRGGIKRFFMGSVAESVLRAASCPVIVVREAEPANAPEKIAAGAA
ncbi:MAG TPA: universal stress protein [Candidatus Baltobacteraceae bacterium]|nr:universal stress protein [Candidatus Baltobacteraceae bacterium]